MYLGCQKCSHAWETRGQDALRRKDGAKKRCSRCGTTKIEEIDKETYLSRNPPSERPSPRAIPRDPTRTIDKSVNDDLKLNLPERIDDNLYDMEVADYKRRAVRVHNRELEAREARLDRQHNNGDSEVQKLREQVNEMRLANLQNQFTSQLQGLQGEFRHMSEVMSRPGTDPVESLVTNLARLRQGDVLEMQSSAEVEAIKNQGKFLDKTMTMIDKRMDSIDGAIREYVNFKKEIAMEGRKAQIRENVKPHPGDGPATLGRERPEPLSPEELVKLAKASDLLLEDDIPKEDVSRMFKCSECGADHLRTSKVGVSHAGFEER